MTDSRRVQVVLNKMPARSYEIHIGAGLLHDKDLFRSIICDRKVFVVTDETVAGLYLPDLKRVMPSNHETLTFVLKDGEEHKTFKTLNQILTRAIREQYDRGVIFIALGGGVVGDLTGFASACFLRGVDFLQIPTTLLAQVDSSVGGKTAVNHAQGKNLIGAFHQPLSVVADINVLSSLPDRQYSAGMAEVLKYGLIADPYFLDCLYRDVNALAKRDVSVLATVVQRCCQIKSKFVFQDEKENGVRAHLNFGHTFGHAIEQIAGYGRWLHGEAVAAGMVLASAISLSRGNILESDFIALCDFLVRFDLPIALPETMNASRLLSTMQSDKKVKDGVIRFVLLKRLGEGLLVSDVSEMEIEAAIAHSLHI